MKLRTLFLILIFILFPNISYAYVDPGIFALVWQSIVAFIFAVLSYFRFFYSKTTRIFKNYSIYSEKKLFVYASNTIIAFLALIVPILHVINKNKIYFVFDDYLTAFYYLFIIFCLITFIVYLSLKILKKKTNYTLTIATFLIILSYFITSIEEYILENLIIGNQVIYFTILLGLLIPFLALITINYLGKFRLNSLKVFLFSFLIILISISVFNLIKDKNFNTVNDENIWKFNVPDYSETNISDNIYFIMTNAYLSPNYFNILYPNQKNNFFKKLKDNNFYLKENSYSNYSSSRFSIPSIFNSNYFSHDITREKYLSSFEINNNILDNSFLIKSLEWNNYNRKFVWCDFQYMFKRKFCSKKNTYLTLMEDIKIFESIYFYNSIYRIFKSLKLTLYEQEFFSKLADRFTQDKDENILLYLENEIKSIQDKKKNFLNIYFELPHVPWILNSDCSWKNIPLSENTKNGMLIKDESKRIKGYIDNLNCVNKYLIKLLEIIYKYDDEAIIIFLSDNGPFVRPYKYLNNKLENKELNLFDQASSILTIGGGSKCLENINYKDLTHVNLFKLVLYCKNKDNFDLLENTVYLEPKINNQFKFKIANTND